VHELAAFFVRPPMGFYRPLVAISFALNERLAGVSPPAYAWVNVALALATAAAIGVLLRRLRFAAPIALFGAAIWAFNFHSLRMALLWTSGRTSLLTALFAALAAVAFVSRRAVLTGVWTLAALLSKEEPVLLPVVFVVWIVLWDTERTEGTEGTEHTETKPRRWRRIVPAFVGLGVYLVLRMQTTALTPATAPAYYRLTLAPGVLLANALAYADRSLTLALAVPLLGWLLFSRRRVAFRMPEGRAAAMGLAWVALGFGVTVMVPVRSSLYVCFPAIGASIVAAAMGSAVWRTIPAARRRFAIASLLLLPLALVPVYRARNARTRAEAELATRITDAMRAAVARQPTASRIVVVDEPGAQPPVSAAFNWALPEAVELTIGRPMPVEIIERGPEMLGPDDHIAWVVR
jgi:uncharacterized membrane protein